jgi:hypothetical protein
MRPVRAGSWAGFGTLLRFPRCLADFADAMPPFPLRKSTESAGFGTRRHRDNSNAADLLRRRRASRSAP